MVEGLAPFLGHPSVRPPELEVADPDVVVVDIGLGVEEGEEVVTSSKGCESLSFWQSGLNL